ncbi:hypothetical protein DACRYDRAFT_119567 [Dacryopinax primogenitus]|uniref:Uncharacterized protein n=1 Tax=Dacryopinax primogenitus (strain DJM 731) TaxID=1858805 RepID=M5FUW9_DACPD|nr:uncharacterized protein DACRYDRAFT_119567 [Dacryopinax primogenitus]EJT97076.1 hypothetical protein DACRYDRAFT_119567 [Dacryopinax primogenitus]
MGRKHGSSSKATRRTRRHACQEDRADPEARTDAGLPVGAPKETREEEVWDDGNESGSGEEDESESEEEEEDKCNTVYELQGEYLHDPDDEGETHTEVCKHFRVCKTIKTKAAELILVCYGKGKRGIDCHHWETYLDMLEGRGGESC